MDERLRFVARARGREDGAPVCGVGISRRPVQIFGNTKSGWGASPNRSRRPIAGQPAAARDGATIVRLSASIRAGGGCAEDPREAAPAWTTTPHLPAITR